MTVSIIMRSKNSEWVIGQALAGLYSQTFREFELLVVDSGSTDGTLAIVAEYPGRVESIAPRDYFPGPVLNRAIASAKGDIVVFQNSDVVPVSAHALTRLLAVFDDPGVDAAFARQIPRPEAHTWVMRDYEIAFPSIGEAPEWMTYSLPFAAMRRSAWEKHHFYSDAWGSEDTEWGAWARRSGVVVRYVPDSVVMHSHNYTLREIYGRRFIEGEADAFIYPGAESRLVALRRLLGSTYRDAIHHARMRDFGGLVASPVRRAVYHYGYLRGHKHGERRRAQGDRDTTVGQRVVLEQFGGAGSAEARGKKA